MQVEAEKMQKVEEFKQTRDKISLTAGIYVVVKNVWGFGFFKCITNYLIKL